MILSKNKTIILIVLIFSALILPGNSALYAQQHASDKILERVPEHPIPFNPRTYICLRTPQAMTIDGRQSEDAWSRTKWTKPFVDIEGRLRDKPEYETRVKMLWDDRNLYIFAKMEEPHVWGTIKQRDAVIFHDNDFEVFIDPDGDTHQYAELEMNALNTVWDLLLTKPYRDGGTPLTQWDMKGLKTAVHIEGTLNNPADTDQYWNTEIAIPWKALREIMPDSKPKNNDQWRINFSRVQWKTEIKNNEYHKKRDDSGKHLPEQNWVWSPQGRIDMHRPETWGILQFSKKPAGSNDAELITHPGVHIKWYMRNLYYRQKQFRREHGMYANNLEQLRPQSLPEIKVPKEVNINAGKYCYVISLATPDNGTWFIDEEGKTWHRNR